MKRRSLIKYLAILPFTAFLFKNNSNNDPLEEEIKNYKNKMLIRIDFFNKKGEKQMYGRVFPVDENIENFLNRKFNAKYTSLGIKLNLSMMKFKDKIIKHYL